MRIGIFTDFYKPSINGVTTSVENYRLELEKLGHEVFIFAPNVSGCKREENVYRLPSINEFSPEGSPIGLPILPIINRVVKPLKLDIIHTQVPFPVGYLGHNAAHKLNIPEVHTYHTHLTEYAHYFPSYILQPLIKYGLKKIARIFCNYSDIVIAPSTAIKNILMKYGVTSPIIVNQSGIFLEEFTPVTPRERQKILSDYKIPDDKKILMFGGRLAPEKNLPFLLKVFEKVIKTYPGVHLIIAGGGPSKEILLKQIKKMGLDKNITVTGFVEKNLMTKLFSLADLFIFPSLTETQGLVICEAFAAGTPVIAVDAMGQKDLVENKINGFLVPTTETAFATKTIELLEDDKLRQVLSLGAKKTAKKYSIESRTQELIRIYKKAIKEHKTHDHSNILDKFFASFK